MNWAGSYSSTVARVFLFAVVLACTRESAAQDRLPDVRPSRIEAGGGVGWFTQSQVGTRDATMLANQPGSETVTFFEVIGRTRSGVVGSGWVGVNLNRAWGVEGGFHYSQPKLSAVIRRDVEATPATTLTAAAFTQYAVEGSLVYHVNQARFDRERSVPFVLIGAGYLRQREDDGATETGVLYQAGVGFKWTSRIDRLRRAHGLGIRLDARYVLRDGGIDFEEDTLRSFVAAGASMFVAF
jgi:Outer membrane protein beta-barrel domain